MSKKTIKELEDELLEAKETIDELTEENTKLEDLAFFTDKIETVRFRTEEIKKPYKIKCGELNKELELKDKEIAVLKEEIERVWFVLRTTIGNDVKNDLENGMVQNPFMNYNPQIVHDIENVKKYGPHS